MIQDVDYLMYIFIMVVETELDAVDIDRQHPAPFHNDDVTM